MKKRNYTAKSIGDRFYTNLFTGSHHGNIQSVYPVAINMEINGNLYCIVKAKIGNSPCTMMMPPLTEDLDTLGIHPGDALRIEAGLFRCNHVEIDFTGAAVWKSDWEDVAYPDRLFRFIPQMKALIAREGNLKGLGWLLLTEEERAGDQRTMDYAQMVLLEQALPMLAAIREVLLKEPAQFWNRILPLVGLGPGKTPAGDDFLTGMILMFRYLEAGQHFVLPAVNVPAFMHEVRQRTNVISAAGFIQAVENHPFELVKDFIENLCGGRKTRMILSALRLMDRGGSSGTDILTGILIAAEMYQEIYYIYQRTYI